jgi:outer membrane protein
MKESKMKKLVFLSAVALLGMAPSLDAGNIAFVNVKTIVEESKLGKQEQASFDSLKDQMEKVLEEKEKELNDLATKFNDADFLDTLSVEAETELKRKFRQLNQEFTEKQQQFMQALQQANMKIMQKLAESVQKASEKIAADKKLDAVMNQDSAFYSIASLDISKDIVKIMDSQYEEDAKKTQEPAKK